MSPLSWLVLFLLGGALPLIPAVMRRGPGRGAAIALGVALIVVDLLMVAATIWLTRSRG